MSRAWKSGTNIKFRIKSEKWFTGVHERDFFKEFDSTLIKKLSVVINIDKLIVASASWIRKLHIDWIYVGKTITSVE